MRFLTHWDYRAQSWWLPAITKLSSFSPSWHSVLPTRSACASRLKLIVNRHCVMRASRGLMVSMGGRQGLQDRWSTAGIALQLHDPDRFVELLELAERIVRIHKDPMDVPMSATSLRARVRKR